MEIAKVMVFKQLQELPGAFKFLEGYIPIGREKVVVMGEETIGNEIYLSIRYSKSRRAKLNVRHFRTLAMDKLREKLLSVKVRNEKIDKLLKSL